MPRGFDRLPVACLHCVGNGEVSSPSPITPGTMSAWDQTVVIGQKVRPGGGNTGPRGPTAIERAKQVGAVKENDRKSTSFSCTYP